LNTKNSKKPLIGYGSIPHLPGSKLGLRDRLTEKNISQLIEKGASDNRQIRIFAEEKVDGSCVTVTRKGNELFCGTRDGYNAATSIYSQHRLFAFWVDLHKETFLNLLTDQETLAGEWLALAHGILYQANAPFIGFDFLEQKTQRNTTELRNLRLRNAGLPHPYLLYSGPPTSIEPWKHLQTSHHGALEAPEGFVVRVEQAVQLRDHLGNKLPKKAGLKWEILALSKWVRPNMPCGQYLSGITAKPPVWNTNTNNVPWPQVIEEIAAQKGVPFDKELLTDRRTPPDHAP
jgi:hypothetical protein